MAAERISLEAALSEPDRLETQVSEPDGVSGNLADPACVSGSVSEPEGLTAQMKSAEPLTGSMSEPEGLSATLQINGVMVTNDYRQLKNVPTINGQRMEGELTDEQKDATRGPEGKQGPKGDTGPQPSLNDTLTSTSTTMALTANQGRALVVRLKTLEEWKAQVINGQTAVDVAQ